MTASGLIRKLGIKPGKKVLVLGAPAGFPALLGGLPEGARLVKTAAGTAHCVMAFVRTAEDVTKITASVLRAVADDGLLWFAYPKKSGPIESDLSRDTGWEPLFNAGFDTVAQISIDDAWTGFRFRPKHLIGKRRP